MMGHYVYKYVTDGEIVYIGKNDTNLVNRINQHKHEEKFKDYLASDIYYCECSSSLESETLETLLIGKYLPVLNVAKKSGCIISFSEPCWKRYEEKIRGGKQKACRVPKTNRLHNAKPKLLDKEIYCSALEMAKLIKRNLSEIVSKAYCFEVRENDVEAFRIVRNWFDSGVNLYVSNDGCSVSIVKTANIGDGCFRMKIRNVEEIVDDRAFRGISSLHDVWEMEIEQLNNKIMNGGINGGQISI